MVADYAILFDSYSTASVGDIRTSFFGNRPPCWITCPATQLHKLSCPPQWKHLASEFNMVSLKIYPDHPGILADICIYTAVDEISKSKLPQIY
jgi:hypothetical protein